MPTRPDSFVVGPEQSGKTLAAAVRSITGLSWSEARRFILGRHVRINGAVTLDDARRLKTGELIELRGGQQPPVPREDDVSILHVDPDLVVVDKPAGVLTLRRGEERDWSEPRKNRQPTLDELVALKLPGSRIRPVHRLDRDTSGIMLFARSPRGEVELIRRFAGHRIDRTYVAVALGSLAACTVDSLLVRDRGDGLRGSCPRGVSAVDAQRAITHLQPIEHIGSRYTVVECRLQTGRTHQIRIHLSESGYMLCGETLYKCPVPGASPVADPSNAPRQALHSAELNFTHPFTGKQLHLQSSVPTDMRRLIERLRRSDAATSQDEGK